MAANLLPSIRFNWSKHVWAHSASSNPDSARILKEGISTSNGSTASIPYTKENGVALVDVRTEVRYPCSVKGSISCQSLYDTIIF